MMQLHAIKQIKESNASKTPSRLLQHHLTHTKKAHEHCYCFYSDYGMLININKAQGLNSCLWICLECWFVYEFLDSIVRWGFPLIIKRWKMLNQRLNSPMRLINTSKALRSFNGFDQLVLQLEITFVWWQIKTVEAEMRMEWKNYCLRFVFELLSISFGVFSLILCSNILISTEILRTMIKIIKSNSLCSKINQNAKLEFSQFFMKLEFKNLWNFITSGLSWIIKPKNTRGRFEAS